MTPALGRIGVATHARTELESRRHSFALHSYVFFCLITLGVVLAAAKFLGFRFNLTSSLPVGLYRVTNDLPALERGTIVLYCLPKSVAAFAHDRGYVPSGGRCAAGLMPVGKVVVAIPGDTVGITTRGITVNGKVQLHSRPLIRDRKGKRLPQLVGGSYAVRHHMHRVLARGKTQASA